MVLKPQDVYVVLKIVASRAEPLRSMITQGDDLVPVWPYAEGKQRGIAFEPLYKSAPIAALRDSCFYEHLALADTLRDGRARERKAAEAELCRRFREAMNDSNREQLVVAARLLRPLLGELVFVATGLLITGAAAAGP